MKLASILFTALLFAAPTALAQQQSPPTLYQPNPDSPIGARNPRGAEGLAQFDFVIGDWDVDITFNGNRYNARWHNTWIVDGFVVMQEWRGPYMTGAEFRAYDPDTNTWSGQNIYSGQEWRHTTAHRDGETMIVVIEADGPRGPFLNRETYSDITPSSFSMRSELSFDNGATWEPGRYGMTATRAAAS
jgi:hypothetical protein